MYKQLVKKLETCIIYFLDYIFLARFKYVLFDSDNQNPKLAHILLCIYFRRKNQIHGRSLSLSLSLLPWQTTMPFSLLRTQRAFRYLAPNTLDAIITSKTTMSRIRTFHAQAWKIIIHIIVIFTNYDHSGPFIKIDEVLSSDLVRWCLLIQWMFDRRLNKPFNRLFDVILFPVVDPGC